MKEEERIFVVRFLAIQSLSFLGLCNRENDTIRTQWFLRSQDQTILPVEQVFIRETDRQYTHFIAENPESDTRKSS